MISIVIGDEERRFRSTDRIDEGWINQTLERRRVAGIEPCIRVNIEVPPVNITLSNGRCGGGGGGRAPNPKELRIFDLWAELGLGSNPFPVGTLIAFLKRLRGLVA